MARARRPAAGGSLRHRGHRVFVLALGLLTSVWACSDGGTDPTDTGEDTGPLTGLEERGGLGFTTQAEELAFLAEVEARSARARVSQIGTSVEGRPIHLVRVGHPQPPSDEQIATGRAVLVVGSQHGNEPAGREMALQLLRDLAFAQPGELVDILADATVLFIPNANPDGRVANTRRNAADIDINRDHMKLDSPEARAIARVLRDLEPDVVVDAHERPGATSTDMELLWPRNLNVHGSVRDLARELVEDRLFGDLQDGGRSVALFGPGPGPPGDENEGILRNAAGLRHHLGLLTESAGGRPAAERVAVQIEVLHSVLAFHRARSNEIATARADAAVQKTTAGRDRSEPFHLFGADNDPPAPEQILDPPPCAYRLTAAQAATLQPQIELFPLTTESAGGTDVLLPMDQPLMTVIPLLADARARAARVEGVPLVSEGECEAVFAIGHAERFR